jgi:hypothetical protein
VDRYNSSPCLSHTLSFARAKGPPLPSPPPPPPPQLTPSPGTSSFGEPTGVSRCLHSQCGAPFGSSRGEPGCWLVGGWYSGAPSDITELSLFVRLSWCCCLFCWSLLFLLRRTTALSFAEKYRVILLHFIYTMCWLPPSPSLSLRLPVLVQSSCCFSQMKYVIKKKKSLACGSLCDPISRDRTHLYCHASSAWRGRAKGAGPPPSTYICIMYVRTYK